MTESNVIPWDSLYSPDGHESEEDEAARRIMAIVPEERRNMARPMLSGWLAMVKANLTDAEYVAFTSDLTNAAQAHLNGEPDIARSILAKYGIDYNMLCEQMA